MIVVGGYLGSGKTTLINQLLADPQGQRLMVLVNDFGAINIDATLLDSASEDTISLTNGCVCCTMGNDLFMAIGDVLKRTPRPDCLIVEASGISDPRKIANAAIAEPDMRYGGIITVVDGENFLELLTDKWIAPQISDQTACADLIVVSKTDKLGSGMKTALASLVRADPVLFSDISALNRLLFSPERRDDSKVASRGHPGYERWQYSGKRTFRREELTKLLRQRPNGMFRAKGFVRDRAGGGWILQVVGQNLSLVPIKHCPETTLIGIGLQSCLDKTDCEKWWNAANFSSPE